jgi:hypothetical protein
VRLEGIRSLYSDHYTRGLVKLPIDRNIKNIVSLCRAEFGTRHCDRYTEDIAILGIAILRLVIIMQARYAAFCITCIEMLNAWKVSRRYKAARDH